MTTMPTHTTSSDRATLRHRPASARSRQPGPAAAVTGYSSVDAGVDFPVHLGQERLDHGALVFGRQFPVRLRGGPNLVRGPC